MQLGATGMAPAARPAPPKGDNVDTTNLAGRPCRRHPARHRFLASLAAPVAAMLALGAAPAQAQSARAADPPWSSLSGGNADNTARLLATQLAGRLGQLVVVDNRPGGSGTIGETAVAKARPDGYTLLLDATAFTVNPSLFPSLQFDAAKDFTPISLVNRPPAAGGARRLAVQDPGRRDRGGQGPSRQAHLRLGRQRRRAAPAGELFQQAARISLTHVPYRGGAPALTDLIGGRRPDVQRDHRQRPLVKSGKLRAPAITSAERGRAGHRCRRWPKPACRASVRTNGTACLRRPAHLARSSRA